MIQKLQKNPFPLILNQGSSANILQALKLTDRLGTPLGFRNLLRLVSMQNADGGFPNNLEQGNPNSVKATYKAARTLVTAGIAQRSNTIASAVKWLVSQQAQDGGWHENPAIKIPESVTWESTTKSVTWYTCQVAKLLDELDMSGEPAFKKAVSFLEEAELPGGWPPVAGQQDIDPDSTVGIGNFLARLHGTSHHSFLKAKAIFEERMSVLAQKVAHETVDDAYELTHLVFEDAPNFMYDEGDERVERVLEALVRAQREDGGWKTFYSGEKSDAAITAYSLEVLVLHGVIDKSDLQEMLDQVISRYVS